MHIYEKEQGSTTGVTRRLWEGESLTNRRTKDQGVGRAPARGFHPHRPSAQLQSHTLHQSPGAAQRFFGRPALLLEAALTPLPPPTSYDSHWEQAG